MFGEAELRRKNTFPSWSLGTRSELELGNERKNAPRIMKKDMMNPQAQIPFPKERIAEFCRKHQIKKLAIFGSALRPDFRADSDIDVLVEFEPGQVPGLAFFGMQDELSTILGRKVDLNTPSV
jgi:predicted nucleotidyltransferase